MKKTKLSKYTDEEMMNEFNRRKLPYRDCYKTKVEIEQDLIALGVDPEKVRLDS